MSSPDRTRATRAALALVTVSIILSGCTKSDPVGPDDPGPAPSEVTALVASQRHLLIEVGGYAALAVQALDANGVPTELEVVWSSENQEIATVDANGGVSGASIGTTKVTATLPASAHVGRTDLRAEFTVSVVDLQPGVVLVPASEVLPGTELLSDPGSEPDSLQAVELRIPLSSGAPPIAIGDRIIASDWSFYGEVTDVVSLTGGSTISIVSDRLEGYVLNARLRYEADGDDFADISPGVGTSTSAPALALGHEPFTGQASSVDLEDLLNKLVKGFDKKIHTFKCKPTVESSVSVIGTDLDPNVDLESPRLVFAQDILEGVPLDAGFYVELALRTTLNGYVEWGDTFEGKIECLLTLASPFVQEGPFVVAFPAGAGFTLEAGAAVTDGIATLSGYIDSTLRYGLTFSPSQLVTVVNESTHDLDNLSVQIEFPSLDDPTAIRGDLQLEAFGWLMPRGGTGLGIWLGLYKKIDDFRLGARWHLDVAGTARQARDDDFAASATLAGYAKRKPEDPLMYVRGAAFLMPFVPIVDVLDDLGVIDLEAMFSFHFADTISSTPRGLLAASQLDATVGDPVPLTLDVTNETFLGSYQLDQVVVYRVAGTGLATTLTEVKALTPAQGQTHFEWTWTPTEADAGLVRFVAFAHSSAFPVAPFQLDDVLSIQVEAEEPELADFFEFEFTWVGAGLQNAGTRDDDCVDGGCTGFAASHQDSHTETVFCAGPNTDLERTMAGGAEISGQFSGAASTDSIFFLASASVSGSFQSTVNGSSGADCTNQQGNKYSAGASAIRSGRLRVPGPGTIVVRATASGNFSWNDDRTESPCDLEAPTCGGSQITVTVGGVSFDLLDQGSEEASIDVLGPYGGEFQFYVSLGGHAGIWGLPEQSFSSVHSSQLSVTLTYYPEGG